MQRRRQSRGGGRQFIVSSHAVRSVVEGTSPVLGGRSEIARYIAQLTGELARLAADAQLELLAYLLSMAESEAAASARAGKSQSSDD